MTGYMDRPLLETGRYERNHVEITQKELEVLTQAASDLELTFNEDMGDIMTDAQKLASVSTSIIVRTLFSATSADHRLPEGDALFQYPAAALEYSKYEPEVILSLMQTLIKIMQGMESARTRQSTDMDNEEDVHTMIKCAMQLLVVGVMVGVVRQLPPGERPMRTEFGMANTIAAQLRKVMRRLENKYK